MEEKNVIFGYGNLVSPLSLAGRWKHSDDIDEIYDRDIRLTDSFDRSAMVDAWNTLTEEYGVRSYPVQTDGFKRFYGIENRGGGMLEVHREQGEWVNGMVYTGLPDDLYDAVTASETGYTQETILLSEFEYYDDIPKDLTVEATIYLPTEDQPQDGISRHPVYHDSILTGFVFLIMEEEWILDDAIEEFARDFLSTTYEWNEETETWQKLTSVDGYQDWYRIENVVESSIDCY